ncbi:GTP cyclohydrolase I FolE [Helicobacter sp. CLO-3]|uniref:GTP cyclohydrolase I FolE n=1 Tax=unclassified Helicobacter TaxID=2593540 RepID=UPI00080495BD|nr:MULTISPECIES: GTP cyclohydrolase I FolE [unclassified Helicobacter]OBV30132.1 GTP cyclohydrolase I FolE [Helicobacter sp. CLO-3]OHU83524.1 GTP cyclohydrolase I FolE [Helicobacter sp. CLO-3]
MEQKIFDEFCARIGENPKREGLKNTPKRLRELESVLYAGYNTQTKDALGALFANDGMDEMVMLKDIEFYSMCEHHILPFFGRIHIGYVPRAHIAGISGLARLVEVFARRLQIQENLTNQIADEINALLEPKGVMVVCEARHLCMSMRQKHDPIIKTSAVRGIFKSDQRTRAEFLELLRS